MWSVTIVGALPAIANAFPTLNPEWVLDLNESLAIAYLLSFTCFAEVSFIFTYNEESQKNSIWSNLASKIILTIL